MTDEQLKLIELLKTLLNNDDIEIIKCVLESVIEDLQDKIPNNKET